MIDAILTNTLLPELSRGVLNRAIEGTRADAGDGRRGRRRVHLRLRVASAALPPSRGNGTSASDSSYQPLT